MSEKKPTWSVPRIKHPKFPNFGAVRLAEFPTRGGPLYLFYQQMKGDRARQVMRALGKRAGKKGCCSGAIWGARNQNK